MRKILLKLSAWISPHLGKVHLPFTRKLITSKDYRECKSVMKNGMILVTNTRGELTSAIIPGFFSHVGQLISVNDVIEATGSGVRKTDLIDFLLSRDYAVLLKPKWLSESQMEEAARIAESLEGTGYDYEFSADSTQFYCSELAVYSYKQVDPNSPLELRNRMGQMTFIPEDFWRAADKFDIVWMSNSLKEKFHGEDNVSNTSGNKNLLR